MLMACCVSVRMTAFICVLVLCSSPACKLFMLAMSFCLFIKFVCHLIVFDRSAELKKFRAVQAEAEKEIEKYKHEKLRKAKDREEEKKQVSDIFTMNIIGGQRPEYRYAIST